MAQQVRQTLSAHQQLTLTPSLRLSLEVLRMASLDLQLFTTQKIEENPLLELSDPLSESPDPQLSEQVNSEAAADSGWDEGFDELWKEANGPDPSEENRPGPLERSSRIPSLQEHLFFQLCTLTEDVQILGLAQVLTEWLDEDGYLRTPTEELAQALSEEPDRIERAVRLLHRLDPPGVGARNLQESLLIQLDRRNLQESLAARIVRDHFEWLARKRWKNLSARLRVPAAQIQEAALFIGRLEPKPARNFFKEIASPLIPDLIIKQTSSGFEVELNDENLPRFRISRSYQALIRNPNTPTEAQHFIREKTRQGQWLINAIAQRNQTILAIGRQIVQLEKEYLEGGIRFLRPLTQEGVARRIGCHSSTVSRAVSGKSIQTPFGVIPLEGFFGGGIPHPEENNRCFSPKTIQAELAQLIANEDRAKPLSDEKLANRLHEQGYPVARRTVAKYRNTLNIPPAHLRHEAA